MRLKNTKESFGWLSISFHWTLAIALIAMYFVGDWMVGLDYYNPWYKTAPDYHRAVGILIGALMIFHLNPDEIRKNQLATVVHYTLYLLVFIMVISGYLISTAKGQGIDVFGLFEVPALLSDNVDRGELAGDIHKWLGLGFILLVALHASAAFLHHFKYKDRTLKRMLGIQQ